MNVVTSSQAVSGRSEASNAAECSQKRRELRNFGLMMAGVLGGIFGVILPWWNGNGPNAWLLAIAAAFALSGGLAPLSLGPVFRVWMKIGGVLGWINTRILLGIVFYLLLLPMAIVMRLKGLDPLSRKLDKKTASYRKSTNYDTDIASQMERPF